MAYKLTSAQRCVLADCVRSAITGWLLTDPVVGQMTRRMEYKATTICGFSFSRFATAAINHLGASYHPRSPGSAADFPLGIAEAAALANDVEMEMATDDQILAAGIIAAHSPLGQPEVCGRDWRTYTTMLSALGLSINDDCPDWRNEVRDGLRPFRKAVAATAVSVPIAAE
jgi:hypothetical protein